MRGALGTALLLLALGAPAMAADCRVDSKAALALDFDAFDQDLEKGWRPLGMRAGCEQTSIALLSAYRKTHGALLLPWQRDLLSWHEGQVRADTGDYRGAIPLLSVWLRDRSAAIRGYAATTIAFLRHDKAALLAARTKMMALPKPPGYDDHARELAKVMKFTPRWPENIEVVDRLVNCFGRPYAEAYASNACNRDP